MNKVGLASKISEEVNVSRQQALEMVEAMAGIVISELKKGGKVTIAGFGAFTVKDRHARNGVNPQNPKERIQIPAVKVAKFKTGKNLKDALK